MDIMTVIEKKQETELPECATCGISKDRCGVCRKLKEHRKMDMYEGRPFIEMASDKKSMS